MADRGGSARFDEPMVHGCGREFWTAASYALHGRACDGSRPPTEGRIAARAATLAAPMGRPRKPFVDEKTERRRETFRNSKLRNRRVGDLDRTPPESNALAVIAGAATDKAVQIVISGLITKRDAIDRAIAALQAVSA